MRIERIEPSAAARPGTAAAILAAAARWAGPSEELDRLLTEIQEMREEDLRHETAEGSNGAALF